MKDKIGFASSTLLPRSTFMDLRHVGGVVMSNTRKACNALRPSHCMRLGRRQTYLSLAWWCRRRVLDLPLILETTKIAQRTHAFHVVLTLKP